jgi:hypothetical protein
LRRSQEGERMTIAALDPIHYQRHRLRSVRAARESIVYLLHLPEEDLGAFVYTWVDGESRASAVLCVYGPGVGEEAVVEAVYDVPVPVDQPFDDWRVGGLRLRAGESASGSFEGRAAGIEFAFEGVHPPYSYASHRDGTLPWFADDRYEQTGTLQGVLRLGDREIAFDATGHRDQSWGIRDWGMCQHYKWLECNAGPEASVHFTQDFVLGESNLRGYVFRDELTAEITALDVDVDIGDDMVHDRFVATIDDDAGRTTTVTGKTFAHTEFPAAPTTTIIVCSDTVEIEGRPGVGQLDLLWSKDYLDLLRDRGLPALPGRPR